MVKLYKIKFLKDTELKKTGEIGEATKKNADGFVSAGYAEYVEESTPTKVTKSKEEKPIPDYLNADKESRNLIDKTLAEQHQEIFNISKKYHVPKKFCEDCLQIVKNEIQQKKDIEKKEEIISPSEEKEETQLERIKRLNRIVSTEYNKSVDQLKLDGVSDKDIAIYVKEASDKRIFGADWAREVEKYKEEKASQVNKELQRIAELDDIQIDLELEDLKESSGISKKILRKRLEQYMPEKPEPAKPSPIGQTTIYRQLSKDFIVQYPFTYDDNKIWWAWNQEEYRWEIVDECHMMNQFDKCYTLATEDAKIKSQIVEALKKVGRLNKPTEVKPTWIQFKDTVVDILTGERFKASPKYFITNPIPHELNKENFEGTPAMDKIFEEWVGKDHIRTLYEILAYCLLPDYPIHRIFCFIGGGLNGKSKFLELLRKFIGEKNVCCTELDILLTSRFEVTRLHKKLACQMGETNFNEMSKTSILKKLSGGDLIGFEYKRANLFEEKNYAKILISTNNLPTTTDKTMGFYRRWMIIDFPNQFSEKKDILNDIPSEEFGSLALKSISILKDLLQKREFTNEGSIEDRQKKYEDHSDPLEKFIKEFVVEDFEGHIWKGEFEKKLNQWNKENRHREMSEVAIGKKMKEKGIEQRLLPASWLERGQARAWIGIKWKEGLTENNTINQQDNQDNQVSYT